MKKVAIGIPVYNGKNFLSVAIDSILAQTYGDFELIISDNASVDGTEEICRRYAHQDSRIRYVRHAKNLGAAINHNVVFNMSNAQYFKWMSHDDVLGPTFLASTVAALEADAGVVLASPGTTLIDEKGAPLLFSPERGGLIDPSGSCLPAMPEKNGDLASSDPVARFNALVAHTILCVEIYGLIRSSALSRTSLQGSYLGGDKILLAELSLQGRFWKGNEPLLFRRCHPAQYSVAGKSDAYRARWFFGEGKGPALLHNLVLQKFVFAYGYGRAILKNDLTMRQRMACLDIVVNRAILRTASWLGAVSPQIHQFYPDHRDASITDDSSLRS